MTETLFCRSSLFFKAIDTAAFRLPPTILTILFLAFPMGLRSQVLTEACLLDSNCIVMWTSQLSIGYRLDSPSQLDAHRPVHLELEIGRLETFRSKNFSIGPTIFSAIDTHGDARMGFMLRNEGRVASMRLSFGLGVYAFDTRSDNLAPATRLNLEFWRHLNIDLGMDVLRENREGEFAWYAGLRYAGFHDGPFKLSNYAMLGFILTSVVLHGFK